MTSHSVTKIPHCLLALLLAMLAVLLSPALHAQEQSFASLTVQLAQSEKDVRDVDRALDADTKADDRKILRAKLIAAKASAASIAAKLQEQIALLDAKMAGLGPVTSGATEAPDIARQRSALNRQRSALDSAIKRGNLVSVEAQQLTDEIEQSEVQQFSERLSEKSPSPLSPGFWTGVQKAFPRDIRRVSAFLDEGARAAGRDLKSGLPWRAILGATLALLILLPGQAAARRLGQRLLTRGAPGGRIRRSAYAIWRVVVGTLSPLLACIALAQGLRWQAAGTGRWDSFLDAMTAAATFSGFTISVLGALLMRSQPSWRIAPISDAVATRLRPFSIILGGLAFLSVMLTVFNRLVGASAAAIAAMQSTILLLHLCLIGATLLLLARIRTETHAGDDSASGDPASAGPGIHPGTGTAALVAWLLLLLSVVSLLSGYVGLGLFLVQMIAWAVVLGSAVYLLMAAIDDVATTLFDRNGPFGQAVVRSLGIRGSAVDQFGVLLSGVLRLVVALLAITLLMSPFGAGSGIGTLFGRLGVLAQGFEVGGIAISPGTILRGIIVLFIGLALVRAFMRWLDGRYLPATDLDGSGRNSVSLVARYVGTALAVIWGLASLGIGIERIAILLSALSVGIGFGLQAITQNFVSGLILLAERPIKIGDLIRVGTDEGDVKRISVRSTEIELPDHSTLIVPNSELITKSVLNKTMANPLGRIQIQFSVPIEMNVDKVREILLTSYREEPAVLDDPAPSAFIDSIADGRVLFNSFAHVGNPRAAYGARSNVFLTLLRRCREEGIEIGTIPQRMELVAPALPSGEAPQA